MRWIVSLFFSLFIAESIQTGETFDFNPVSTGTASNCDNRIASATARIEVGQNTSSYGGIGVCGTGINNTFIGKDTTTGRLNSSGTGFLVSLDPPILVTNVHVLRDALNRSIIPTTVENNYNPCLSGELRFNFTSINQSVGCRNVSFSFFPETGVDAVFIELDRVPEGADYLPLDQNPSTEGQVRLAGHPFGSDQLSVIDCNLINSTSHNCDSTQGSSGSALINSECRVQGLHFGSRTSDPLCQQTFAYDSTQKCVNLSPVPSHCHNSYHSSTILIDALSLIRSNQIRIDNPLHAFDSRSRYGLSTSEQPINASDSTVD